MEKISFVGDIMCEEPLEKTAERYGSHKFGEVFKETKKLFSESDYVIGNLETVFAGEKMGYTRELYNFNTPDSFAKELAKSGINMVTTATNHSLDKGIDGLCRTIDILDKYGIEHTGTFKKKEDKEVFIKNINDLNLAILNYSYGTNVHESGVILKKDERFHINLLKPQTYNLQTYVGRKECSVLHKCFSKLLGKILSEKKKMQIKKKLHMTYNLVRIDHLDYKELDETYLEEMDKEIEKAKEEANVVIACIHSGGQFNAEPGGFTKFIVEHLEKMGVNVIVANHPHVVQKCENVGKSFVAFCLGNYSISPSSVYLLHDLKPEYSIVLHLYFDKGKLMKKSFSILKIVEDCKHGLKVYPVDELYLLLNTEEKEKLKLDIVFIYKRFVGKEISNFSLEREYWI